MSLPNIVCDPQSQLVSQAIALLTRSTELSYFRPSIIDALTKMNGMRYSQWLLAFSIKDAPELKLPSNKYHGVQASLFLDGTHVCRAKFLIEKKTNSIFPVWIGVA